MRGGGGGGGGHVAVEMNSHGCPVHFYPLLEFFFFGSRVKFDKILLKVCYFSGENLISFILLF